MPFGIVEGESRPACLQPPFVSDATLAGQARVSDEYGVVGAAELDVSHMGLCRPWIWLGRHSIHKG